MSVEDLFAGRDGVVSVLETIFGAGLGIGPASSLVWLHGPRGTGKRQLLLSVLQRSSCISVFASCAECTSHRELADAWLAQLVGRQASSSSGVLGLRKWLDNAWDDIVLIADDVDRWLGSSTSNDLRPLLELSRVQSRSVSVVFIGSASLDTHWPLFDTESVIQIYVPPWNVDALTKMILADCGRATAALQRKYPELDWTELYSSFVSSLLADSQFEIVRLTVPEYRRFVHANWTVYTDPIQKDLVDPSETSKLWAMFSKRRLPLISGSLSTDECPRLPIITRLLLIASFLSSTATAKSTKRTKKAAQMVSSAAPVRAASLDDLLGIFKEIARAHLPTDESIDVTSAPVLDQLASLVSLGLVVVSGSRYRCAATTTTVQAIAAGIQGFKLEYWQK